MVVFLLVGEKLFFFKITHKMWVIYYPAEHMNTLTLHTLNETCRNHRTFLFCPHQAAKGQQTVFVSAFSLSLSFK